MIPVETALIIGAVENVVLVVVCLVLGHRAGWKAMANAALRDYDAARLAEKGIREGKPAAQYRRQLKGGHR